MGPSVLLRARELASLLSQQLLRATTFGIGYHREEDRLVLEETQDEQEVIARVAALDIGKAELVCCVQVPDPKGGSRRVQEVTTYSTMTRSLQLMAERLLDLGVTRVVMEATSSYWKPPFYLLEAHGFQTWLVNARDVKNLPRAAQDGSVGRGVVVQGRRTPDAAA
jgi:hypothetical protein